MRDVAKLRLYLVSDEALCPFPSLLERLPALVRAGVSMVQLRDKNGEARVCIERARAARAVLAPLGVPLIVNDRLDIAMAAGADGVHLGPHDVPPAHARAALGPRAWIGASIEDPEEDLGWTEGADHLAASPLFGTTTKLDTAPPLGLEGLRSLRARTERPCIGIGGIDLERVEPSIAAGADGIAVISAVLGAPDPVAAAAALRSRVDEAMVRRGQDAPVEPSPHRAASALTVAGSDSGGGAGIQADIKAISARGVYAASVLTALTAQNTREVRAIHPVPPGFVRAQLDAVFEDIRVDATKVGMLASSELVQAVASGLRAHEAQNVVVDPVMVAKSGDRLLAADAVASLRERLLPLATLITPNLPEAADLLGRPSIEDREGMRAAALALLELGPRFVLLKGGHLDDPSASDDLLVGSDGSEVWYRAARVSTRNTHGTGCTLSAAIAAELATGQPVKSAVGAAKLYLEGALRHADRLGVGAGHGPVHHFHQMWESHR